MKHNVNRFSATMLGHGGHPWYYLVALPLLVFPFAAPLAGALAGWRMAGRDDVQRFAWCAFVPVLVFFSLSRTQLPHYLLYGMTPLFLLLALHRRRYGGAIATVGPALAGLALAAALPWIAGGLVDRAPNALGRLLLADFAASMRTLVVPASVAFVLLVAAALLAGRVSVAGRADARLFAAGAVPALFMVGALWPQGVTWFQAPVAAAGVQMRGQPDLVEWNANWPSFSVYRRAVTPMRRPQPGQTVLTRSDRVDVLPPHDVLFARREVVVARIRP
jgi:4-amino-4-deoxy-L-arabinose transferase-like glycosyltransferase